MKQKRNNFSCRKTRAKNEISRRKTPAEDALATVSRAETESVETEIVFYELGTVMASEHPWAYSPPQGSFSPPREMIGMPPENAALTELLLRQDDIEDV